MPEDQQYIYYASGESRWRLGQLPQLELLRQKGYDVLFMTDEVDEFVPQSLMKYADKELRNITTEDLGLATEEEKKAAEEKAEQAKTTLDFVKDTLGDAVKEVRLSANLGSRSGLHGAGGRHDLRNWRSISAASARRCRQRLTVCLS